MLGYTNSKLPSKSGIKMWAPTIDGDIDVDTCFPLSIDVGGLGP
jgi:hypothetical protein